MDQPSMREKELNEFRNELFKKRKHYQSIIHNAIDSEPVTNLKETKDFERLYISNVVIGLKVLSALYPKDYYITALEVFNTEFTHLYARIKLNIDEIPSYSFAIETNAPDVWEEHYRVAIYTANYLIFYCCHLYGNIKLETSLNEKMKNLHNIIMNFQNYQLEYSVTWQCRFPQVLANEASTFEKEIYIRLCNLRQNIFFENYLEISKIELKNNPEKADSSVSKFENADYFEVENYDPVLRWITDFAKFGEKLLIDVSNKEGTATRFITFAWAAILYTMVEKGWMKSGSDRKINQRFILDIFKIKLGNLPNLDIGRSAVTKHPKFILYKKLYAQMPTAGTYNKKYTRD